MEKTCSDCRYFRVTDEREGGPDVGKCRLEKVIGVFRGSMRACPSFSRHGDPNPPVVSGGRSTGRRRRRASVQSDEPMRSPEVSGSEIAEAIGALEPGALKQALLTLAGDAGFLDEDELGRGWDEGQLVLAPADGELKTKNLSLDQYFHKLVMIRDNLRVFEQKVNSHQHLHDGERVDLHRRILLCHAALIRMARGWVPRTSQGELADTLLDHLDELRREAEWKALAMPPPVLGERWRGGVAHYEHDEYPVDEPIETFFVRLVILRDRLHALEALISAHAHIAPDEADSMGGYVRRCYGTLTSFNLLFRDRADYFSSSR